MRFPKPPPTVTDESWRELPDGLDPFAMGPTLDDGRYLHWDKLRHREPPEGLSVEQWWVALKFARRRRAEPVEALQRAFEQPFHYADLPGIREALHRFDRANVARAVATALGEEAAAGEYRIRQLVEEAISSSLIEGARPTTRDVARKLVQEQRTPTSRDERMVLNSWFAMQRVRELVGEDRPLSLADLCELHRILGEDCLEVPGAEGRIRGREQLGVSCDVEG